MPIHYKIKGDIEFHRFFLICFNNSYILFVKTTKGRNVYVKYINLKTVRIVKKDNLTIWFCLVLWHLNFCWLFNAKIIHSFFQAAVVSILLYGCTTLTLNNGWRKSLTATIQECCEQFWTSPGGNTPQSSSCMATYLPSQKLSNLDKPGIQDTAGKAGTSS